MDEQQELDIEEMVREAYLNYETDKSFMYEEFLLYLFPHSFELIIK